jgi:hypothetical protein
LNLFIYFLNTFIIIFLYIDTCSIRCPNATFDLWLQLYIDSSMQGYNTSLIHLNWMQVDQLAIDTILFYDIQVNKIILILLTYCYTPTHREGAILQSPCPSVHTFVTDISASTGRNDCTSTSCLPCDLQMNEWGYS